MLWLDSMLDCCCSVAQSCLTLCNPIDWSTPGFPVLHYLPGFAQTHVLWVSDAIQSYYPLSPPSPPALNISQHQNLFQWISSLHQVAKVLELQFQHRFFQWIPRVYDYLSLNCALCICWFWAHWLMSPRSSCLHHPVGFNLPLTGPAG